MGHPLLWLVQEWPARLPFRQACSGHALSIASFASLVGLLVRRSVRISKLAMFEELRASSKRGRRMGWRLCICPASVDHQLGVGDHAQVLHVVFDGPLEHAQQAGVLA